MDSFSSSVELVRITFLFGAALAMFYKKNTGITPGGIIVPAFLALIVDTNFIWFITILLISLVTNLIYRSTISSLALSRHWTLMVNISMGALLTLAVQFFMPELLPLSDAAVFGFVLPGLIATAAYYQKYDHVINATLFVTAVTYTFGWLLYSLIPYTLSSKLAVQLASFAPLSISSPQILIPVSLAAVAASYYFFKARSGGYMIAPVVAAIFSASLVQFGLFVVGVLAAYLMMRVLLKYSLIVGLERFLYILFLSTACVTVIDIFAVSFHISNYQSAPLISIIAMAVWVNDLCLQPLKKSVGGGMPVPLSSTLAIGRVIG